MVERAGDEVGYLLRGQGDILQEPLANNGKSAIGKESVHQLHGRRVHWLTPVQQLPGAKGAFKEAVIKKQNITLLAVSQEELDH